MEWILIGGLFFIIYQLHIIADRLLGIGNDLTSLTNWAQDWHADWKLKYQRPPRDLDGL